MSYVRVRKAMRKLKLLLNLCFLFLTISGRCVDGIVIVYGGVVSITFAVNEGM